MACVQENGPLSERHAALVMYECLKVVSTCHALGIVHGDVKPANFLLRQRMRDPLRFVERGQMSNWLKAIDFGCSQVLRGAQLHRRTGTPGAGPYMRSCHGKLCKTAGCVDVISKLAGGQRLCSSCPVKFAWPPVVISYAFRRATKCAWAATSCSSL
jgi:serine/threonine protein kinase